MGSATYGMIEYINLYITNGWKRQLHSVLKIYAYINGKGNHSNLKYNSPLDPCKRRQMGYFKQDKECLPNKYYIITWLLAKWQNLMLCVTMATGHDRFPPNLSWGYARNLWFLFKVRPIEKINVHILKVWKFYIF